MEITTRGFLILSATFFSLSAQALHTPAGIPSGTTLKTVSPMVISRKKDVVIRGVRISNPSGPCIIINNGSKNILIENSEIGPCASHGININGGSTQVKVQNSYLHDIKNVAVYTYNVTGVHVYNNRIERYKKGVYSVLSKQTVVRHNKFLNGNPWKYSLSGQAVQFNTITGSGNRVNCNVVENRPGESYVEDPINMYKSSGVSGDPIQIMSNKIRGGGPSTSSGGINPSDTGSSYVLMKDNILVDPAANGTGIGAGHHIQIINNLIYGRSQPFTWSGISVWNQLQAQGMQCYSHTIGGNQVNWTNRNGKKNPYFLKYGTSGDRSCGTIAGWSTNIWNAPIGPSIWDLPRPACTNL